MGRGADGSVVFDDPASPWIVRLWPAVDEAQGRAYVSRLSIDVRPGGEPINPSRLARLPLPLLTHMATALDRAQPEHPNETYYRMLASIPKPPGQRHWDAGHWDRVLAVYDWAAETERPGGPARAVAEFWGVAVDPTVYRWLEIAQAQKQ